ncbi:hypothetical protein ACFWNR_16305 [Streptomyces virginiae]|uniref:hypothetical protein n=1 Tax=Streptomyces virginiae TaxID=1961 RepID=UPI003668D26C
MDIAMTTSVRRRIPRLICASGISAALLASGGVTAAIAASQSPSDASVRMVPHAGIWDPSGGDQETTDSEGTEISTETGGVETGTTNEDASHPRTDTGTTNEDASHPRTDTGATNEDASHPRTDTGATNEDASHPRTDTGTTNEDNTEEEARQSTENPPFYTITGPNQDSPPSENVNQEEAYAQLLAILNAALVLAGSKPVPSIPVTAVGLCLASPAPVACMYEHFPSLRPESQQG